MRLQDLIKHAGTIQVIVEGTSWTLDECIDELVTSEDWDLAGRLLVSAAEISARQLAQKLLEKEAYEALAIAACLRRQPRRPGEGAVAAGGGGIAGRVFRDVDAEEGGKGVPDYIRADMEEMAKTASETRAGAMARDAQMDRDPVRQYIVEQIASQMSTSPTALDAMVAIARSSAWEETRRLAALKIANAPIAVARMATDLRTEDIEEVCEVALLGAVAETFAREMGKRFQAFADAKDAKALRFVAQHHPDAQYKESATGWAEAIEKQQASGAQAGE